MVGHVLERVSLTRLLVFLDFAIQFILGTHTNLAGLVLQAFVGLPHSRKQELEADLIGLRLMSKACFDPEAVVRRVSLRPAVLLLSYDFPGSGNHLIRTTQCKLHGSCPHTRGTCNAPRYATSHFTLNAITEHNGFTGNRRLDSCRPLRVSMR